MSNKKKIVVMSALVLLLAVTAVFNFVLANTNALASPPIVPNAPPRAARNSFSSTA